MFKTRAPDNSNNLVGPMVRRLRKEMKGNVSQHTFAHQLQLSGMDVCKNAVQLIEKGKRFVTDVELVIIAEVLDVSILILLGIEES